MNKEAQDYPKDTLVIPTEKFKELISKFKDEVKKQQDYLEERYIYEDTVMSSYEVIEILDKFILEILKERKGE